MQITFNQCCAVSSASCGLSCSACLCKWETPMDSQCHACANCLITLDYTHSFSDNTNNYKGCLDSGNIL